MKDFKFVGSNFELGREVAAKPRGQIARLDPDRIVYTDHLMRKQGCAPRQIWRKGETETRVVPGGNV